MAYMHTLTHGTGSRHPAAQGFTTRERKDGSRQLRRREDRAFAAGFGWEEEPTVQCRGVLFDGASHLGRYCEQRIPVGAHYCAPCAAYLQRLDEEADLFYRDYYPYDVDGNYLS